MGDERTLPEPDESAIMVWEEGEEGAPEAAAPAKEEPAPAKEPEKQPEPEPESEPDDEVETLTLEELAASISADARKAVADAIREAREAPQDDDDVPQEVKDLRAENARLKAENESRAKAAAEREEADAMQKLQHQMRSAIGKYKMTEAEHNAVVEYMTANEDLVIGGMGYEEAALRRLPDLRTRLRTEPPAPKAPTSTLGEAPPAASGPGAPTPFKHTANPGDYSDITAHLLKSGQAAALFNKD